LQGFLLHQNKMELAKKARDEGLMEGGTIPAQIQPDVLIQWDKFPFTKHANMILLNRQQAVRQAMDPHLRTEILKLNGIPTISLDKSIRFARRYYVILFQYQVLGVYLFQKATVWRTGEEKSRLQRGTFISQKKYSPEVKRAIRLATDALYALGLDFGGVWIGVPSSRSMMVVDMDPTPKHTPALLGRYVRTFARYCQTMRVPDEILLGTDVEFLLMNRAGKLVPASQFMSYRGRVGHDAYRDPLHRSDYPIAELRPLPSRHPLQLYRNLYATMKQANRMIASSNLAWLVGNQPVANLSIGGHLHFGKVPLHFLLIRVLDEYLALPFRILEDPRGILRRPKYGKLGDVRTKLHGFEYRTLSSFIYSPKIALATFVLAKFLVQHHLKLPIGTFLNSDVMRSFYSGNGAELYTHAEEKMSLIESMPQYEEIRKQVDPLFQKIREGTPWDESQDIRPAWKLTSSR